MQTYTIRSEHLSATFLSRGASLVDLRLTALDRNLVLGFADPSLHATVPVYAGAIVGPVANRIAGGEMPIAGKIFQMPQNEPGGTSLHSGPDGLHDDDWQAAAQLPTRLTFQNRLANGQGGLPGNRDITVEYALVDHTLTLTITATTDAPTPMNIAAHPYWNLGGGHDISDHTLWLSTDRYLPTDARNLPTGEIASADNDAFDFTQTRNVPLSPTLDVNYCLAEAPVASPELAAILTAADGTELRLATTAPGLQVYNGGFLPQMTSVLSGGRDIVPFGAIALEPQHWPDAPHHPAFPSILLNPGETYTQTTTYTLRKKA